MVQCVCQQYEENEHRWLNNEKYQTKNNLTTARLLLLK